MTRVSPKKDSRTSIRITTLLSMDVNPRVLFSFPRSLSGKPSKEIRLGVRDSYESIPFMNHDARSASRMNYEEKSAKQMAVNDLE